MTKSIEQLTNGLVYISETDAEILPFTLGKAAAATALEILTQTGTDPKTEVETIDADAFFGRLTAIKDWYGDREKQRAARFAELKAELERELTDIKVFKFGLVRREIYIAGLDKNGRISGVRTKSVET